MKNPTYKQLQAYLEICEAKLDIYNSDQCKAILCDSESIEVASILFGEEIYLCENHIYIGEEKYNLSEVQQDLVLEYLGEQTEGERQTWNEIKADKYNVRNDQY
jgi:hypothetical protein